MQDSASGNPEALAQAQATIARQAEEIERLRQRIAGNGFAEELRAALSLAATTGTIAAQVTRPRLLEMIVGTAAQVINARAASLFLLDEQTQELVFEVALGQKAEDVKKFRIPLGHGIAGLVAITGQPMAISDAQSNPQQAADISQSVGYAPQSILCVPLFYEDQVIGVLELLDKEGASSFSASDMAALGLFANQAAIAIEQSRTHENLVALVDEVLRSVAGAPGDLPSGVQAPARSFVADLEQDASYRRSLDLARLVQEIAHQGDSELAACRAILRGFAEYLQARPLLGGELGRLA